MTTENPLFVIDVDCTIYDNKEPTRRREGIELLFGSLALIGEVHLWSAAGAEHAAAIAAAQGLQAYVAAVHDKPAYPPTEKDAIRILGRPAALQVDDDETERVADWPFLKVEAFWPEVEQL
jgi:hypothetical protein